MHDPTPPPVQTPAAEQPESKLSIALREELAKFLEGNLTEGKARRLSKIAQTGATLLKMVRPDIPGVDDLKRKDAGFVGAPGYDMPEPVDDDGESGEVGPNGTYVMASAPPAETFGTRMFREMMTVLPGILGQQQQTPERLVDAITLARQNGLTDVAAELERKLLGKSLDGDRPVNHPLMTRIRPIRAEQVVNEAVSAALTESEDDLCSTCRTDCSRDPLCTPKGGQPATEPRP